MVVLGGGTLEDLHARAAMVKELQGFRPTQTILEAGKGEGGAKKGGGKGGKKKGAAGAIGPLGDLSKGKLAMKEIRMEHRRALLKRQSAQEAREAAALGQEDMDEGEDEEEGEGTATRSR